MISGKFQADFSSFEEAVKKAIVTLKSLSDNADKVPAAMTRIGNSLTGTKLIQDATMMAQSVERLGGVSILTEKELAKLGGQAQEAAEKMKLLGIDVPKNLQAIADAATAAAKPIADVGKAATDSQTALGGIGASFTNLVAGVATGELIADVFKKIGEELLQLGIHAAEVLPMMVEHAIEVGNSLFEMSLKTGASVENLSKLRFVASQTGIDFQSFGTTLFKMEQNLDATGKKGDTLGGKLAAIGLNLRDLKNSKPDDAFITIMSAMEKMSSRAEQASLGVALFGKGFKDMAGLTQESIKDLMKEAEDLGLVMSTQDAAAAHAAEVGWKKFQMQLEAASMSIGNVFVPAVTTALNLLSEGFTEAMKNTGVSTKDLQEILKSVTTDIAFFLADLVKVAAYVGDALAQAFSGQILEQLGLLDFIARVGAKLIGLGEIAATITGNAFLLNTLEDLRGKFDTVGKKTEEYAGKVAELAGALHTLEQGAQGAANNLKAGWDAALKKTEDQIKHFAETSHKAFGGAGEDTESFGEKNKKATKDLESLEKELYKVERQGYQDSVAMQVMNAELLKFGKGDESVQQLGKALEQLPITVAKLNAELDKTPQKLSAIANILPQDTSGFFLPSRQTVPTIQTLGQGAYAEPAGLEIGKDFSKGFETGIAKMPDAILRALEGGGNVFAAAAGTIGQSIGESLQKNLNDTILKNASGVTGSLLKGFSAALPAIGALAGPLVDALFGIGGPSKAELAGRDAVASFEKGFGSAEKMINAVGAAYVAEGKTVEEAQKDIKAMWAAEKQGADATTAAVRKLQDALAQQQKLQQGAAQFGPSKTELEQMAKDAKDVYDFMLAQGTYTADQLAAAFKASQEAQAAALGINTEATKKHLDEMQKGLEDLMSRRDALWTQVSQEAPEEVMGVIETAQRAQLGVLDDQIAAQKKAIEKEADDAAAALEAALNQITPDAIHVPVVFDWTNAQDMPSHGQPQPYPGPAIPMARGGDFLVTKPTLFLAGEAGPERATFSPSTRDSDVSRQLAQLTRAMNRLPRTISRAVTDGLVGITG